MRKLSVAILLLVTIFLCGGFKFAVSAQDSTARESLIDFSVIAQTGSKERIPGAQVTATDEKGKTLTLTTDRNGRCRFQNYQLGRIKIYVKAVGFVDASIDQPLVNKQEVAMTLLLPEK